MDENSVNRNPVEQLAEDFMQRKRRGESPRMEDYVERFPHLAEDIRELFPALAVMEELKPETGDLSGKGEQPIAAKGALPEKIGDYRVLREIGRGGMGLVYEAEQLSLGRRVALKILPRSLAKEATSLERFRREARNAARLHHTNIVPVFEVGVDEDTSYYAMQYIHGQGLDEVLTELTALRSGDAAHTVGRLSHGLSPAVTDGTPSDAVEDAATSANECSGLLRSIDNSGDTLRNGDLNTSSVKLPGSSEFSVVQSGRRHYFLSVAHIGRQIADALAYAHSRGVVHRDIKPSNLLLDAAGVVWITDFGLAKAEDDDLTESGSIVGTLRYMAPERFRGESDAQSDVYALGATLYELLTLKPAFQAVDRLRIVEQIAKVDPPRPRSIDPSIPRDLETIVVKAMEKSRRDRYNSAASMSEDLRRFINDEPIAARRVSPLERLTRWSRHHKSLAGSSLVIAILLLASTIAATFFAAKYSELAQESQDAAKDAIAKGQETENALKQVQESETMLRKGVYVTGVAALPTYGVWDNNWYQLERLQGLLPPDQERPFETFWHRGFHQEPDRTIRASHAPVFALDVSASGNLAATSGGEDDKRVVIWDLESEQAIHVLRGPDSGVFRVAFDPTGSVLAVVHWNSIVCIYDTTSGRELRTLVPPLARASAVCWHPAGEGLAIAGRNINTVGKIVFYSHDYHEKATLDVGSLVLDAEWNSDGRRIVCGHNDGGLSIIDVDKRRVERHWSGHTRQVCDVGWDPQGQRIASASLDSFVFIWDEYGNEIHKLAGHYEDATAVVWSPDGQWLVSSGSGSLRMWNAKSGAEYLWARANLACWSAARWNAASDEITLGTAAGTVEVWDAEKLHAMRAAFEDGPLRHVCSSGSGSRFAFMQEGGPIRLWDLLEGVPLHCIPRPKMSVAALALDWSGRQLAIVSEGGEVNITDTATARSRVTFEPPKELVAPCTRAVWCPKHSLLMIADDSQQVYTLDLETGQWQPPWSPRVGGIRDLACSSSGQFLAVGGSQGIHVVDLPSLETKARLRTPQNWIRTLAWRPDGRALAFGGGAPEIGGTELMEGNMQSIAGSPEGSIRIWRVGDSPLTWHTLAVTAATVQTLAWRHDGKRLLSKTSDRTAKIWDVTSFGDIPIKQDLLTIKDIYAPGGSGFWAGHGMFFVLVDGAGVVRVWDARPGYRAARSLRMLPQLEKRIQSGSADQTDRRLRAEILLANAQPVEAAHQFDEMPAADWIPARGTAWWTIGPFVGRYEDVFPPETALKDGFPKPSELVTSQRSGRPQRWQLTPTDIPIDLNRFYPPAGRRCCYALTRYYAAKQREAWLIVTDAASGSKIWWNDPSISNDVEATLDVIPVVLQPGWNTLMVKAPKIGEDHALNIKLSIDPVELGWACNSAGRWRESIEHWDRALESNPHDHRSRYQRALASLRAGQQQEALVDCRTLLTEASDCRDLFADVCRTLHELGATTETIDTLARLIEQADSPGLLYEQRGWLCCALGRWSEAEKAFRHAATLNPSNPINMYYSALLAYCVRDSERYQSACDELLRANAEESIATNARRTVKAWLLTARSGEELERLAPLMQLATAEAPDSPWTWVVEGEWLLRRGDYEAAIAKLKQCSGSIIVARQHASTLLAQAYFASGNRQSAVEQLRDSRQLLSEMLQPQRLISPDLPTAERIYEDIATLLDVDPGTAAVELQANILLARRQLDKAAELAAQITDQDDNYAFVTFRANLMGRTRQWANAAEDIRLALEREYNPFAALARASALAKAGNIDGFRENANWALREHRETDGVGTLEHRCKTLVLAPLPEDDPLVNRGLQFIESSLRRAPNRGWGLATLAMAQCRAGHYDEAVESAKAARRLAPLMNRNHQLHIESQAHAVEALALARAGQNERARPALQRARHLLDHELPKMDDPNVFWHDRVIAELFYDEAEAVLRTAPN